MPLPPDMAQPLCSPVLTVPASTCGVYPQCGCSASTSCDIEDDTSGKASCVAVGTTPDWNNCSGNGEA